MDAQEVQTEAGEIKPKSRALPNENLFTHFTFVSKLQANYTEAISYLQNSSSQILDIT